MGDRDEDMGCLDYLKLESKMDLLIYSLICILTDSIGMCFVPGIGSRHWGGRVQQ